MSNREVEVLTVVHFDREFQWELNAIYNSSQKKVLFLDPNMNHTALVEKLLSVTKWVIMKEVMSIQYLHQNGRILTLIDVKDDDDVHSMMATGGSYTNAIYISYCSW